MFEGVHGGAEMGGVESNGLPAGKGQVRLAVFKTCRFAFCLCGRTPCIRFKRGPSTRLRLMSAPACCGPAEHCGQLAVLCCAPALQH